MTTMSDQTMLDAALAHAARAHELLELHDQALEELRKHHGGSAIRGPAHAVDLAHVHAATAHAFAAILMTRGWGRPA